MMFGSSIRFTHHARDRMRQRSISERDVRDVVRRGTRRREGNSVLVRIRKDQFDKYDSRRLKYLADIVVVLTSDEDCVKTAYRKESRPRRYPRRRRAWFDATGSFCQLGDIVDLQDDEEDPSSNEE